MAKKKLTKKTISLICSFAFVIIISGLLIFFIKTEQPVEQENSSVDETITFYNKNTTDIEKISVERENDVFDITIKPETDATFYIEKIKDFDRQENKYTAATNAIATLSCKKLIAQSTNDIAQYGLDKPQTKITFKFKDENPRTILLGNISPDDEGAYMKFEDEDNIYLSSAILRNIYTYGSASFISTTVVPPAAEDTEPVINFVEFGGTSRKDKIVVKHTPTDDSSPIGATEYTITQPAECYINTDYSASIFKNFFGIYASEVIAYNASEQVIKDYELDKPFSTLKVNYDDKEYEINLGKQTTDYYFASITGKNIIYKIAKESIAWADTSFEKLHALMLFTPSITDVKQLTIKANGKEYVFDINQNTAQSNSYNITCNGQELDENNFKKLYQVLISTKADELAGEITNNNPLLEYTFKFYGKTPDLNVKFYQTTARKAAAQIDGETTFQVSMTYIDKVINDIDNLFNNVSINVEWS